MTQLTRDWIAKAEGDFQVAVSLLRPRKFPNHDAVCFHAQQCAEKYMKAVLQDANITFAKTHVLTDLLTQLAAVNPMWEALRDAATLLSTHAVKFRYPGEFADRVMARDAVAASRFIRTPLRAHLGIVDDRKRVVAKRAAIRKKGGTRKRRRSG
ncbi:MAG: HEPN domain-containing protein [Phycisphaerae bacterium]